VPTYLYKTEDGKHHEVVMTVAEMESRQGPDRTIVLDDGQVAKRDIAAEHGGFQATAANWPLVSVAGGINPDQREEISGQLDAMGVHTDFTADGSVIWRDRKHRKEYLRAMRWHDKNGGYGD
jgi:hypothetical protein